MFRLPPWLSPWTVYLLALVVFGWLVWTFPPLWEIGLAGIFGGLYWVFATKAQDRDN